MTRPSILLLLTLLLASQASAAERSYSFAYVRFAEGRVTLQRASETEPEEVGVNYPVLPSDRLWTGSDGRVEIDFADRSLLRLDQRTKVDFLELSESSERENLLRQWSGSTIMRWSGERGERFRIDTPAGTVFPAARGVFRIDVHEGGQAVTLSTYEGVAELASEGGSVLVRSGQRTVARGAERPEAPFDFNTAYADDFTRWSDERDRRLARARRIEGLPDEVAPYASDLEDYGYWQHDVSYGNVWYPVVGTGWAPYTYGRWWYTPFYGWTWCAYEPWGWAPYHYGRWGFNSYGWFWIPGRHWSPAWVSWAFGPSWVGWCPLGFYNRPVVVFDSVFHRGGRAVPRQRVGNGWSFARVEDFSSPSIERARLRAEDVRLSAREARLFESGAILDRDLRPRADAGASLIEMTRGGRSRLPAGSSPRERGEGGDLSRGPTPVTRGGEAGQASSRADEPTEVRSGTGRIDSPRAESGEARARNRGREFDGAPREGLGPREPEARVPESPAVRPRYRSDDRAREPRAVRPGEIRREGGTDSSSARDSGRVRPNSEGSRGAAGVLRRLFPERQEPREERARREPSAEADGGETRGRVAPRERTTGGGVERSTLGGRAREPAGGGAGSDVGRPRTSPRESGSSQRYSGRSRESYRPPSAPSGGGRGDSGPRYRSPDRGSSRAPSSGGSGGGTASRPSGGRGAASTRRSRDRDE